MKTGIYKLPSNFGGGLNYLSQDALQANESPGPVWNYAPFILSKTGRLEAELHGGIETLNKLPGTVRESDLTSEGGYYYEGLGIYRFPEDLGHPEGRMRNQVLLINARWNRVQRWVQWPMLWHLDVENGNISKPEDYSSHGEFYENHRYVDTRGASYYFPHGITYNMVIYKNLAVILPFYEMMEGYYGLWKTNVAWNAKEEETQPAGAMGYATDFTVEPVNILGGLESDKTYKYFIVWKHKQTEEEGGLPTPLMVELMPGATVASGYGALRLNLDEIDIPDWTDWNLYLYRYGPFDVSAPTGSMINYTSYRISLNKGHLRGSYIDSAGSGSSSVELASPLIYRNAPVARCGVVWQDSLWLAGFPESPFIDYPPKPPNWTEDVFHPFWLIHSRPGTLNFADYNFGWNYIDLGTAGGDVVGIAATETQLLVFRTHQIHRIRVYGNSYENRIISTDKGIWNQQAIATDGENVYFYDYLGNTIWRYDGVNFQDVGVKLSPYFQRERSGTGTGDEVRSVQQNYRLYFFDGRLYVSRFSMGENLKPREYETHIGEFRGSDVVWTRVPWGAMFFADTGSFGADGLMGDLTDRGKPALLVAGKYLDSNALLLRHNDVTKYEDAYTGLTLELLWGSKWSDFDLPGYIKRIAVIRFNVEHYREDGGSSQLKIGIYKDHQSPMIWGTTVTIEQDPTFDKPQYKYEVQVPDTVRGESFQIGFSENAIEKPDDYLRVKAPVLIEYFYNPEQYG